jgi:virginiamycin A acetyltransferase
MGAAPPKKEGRQFFLGGFLCWLYPHVNNWIKKRIRTLCYMAEGGHFFSISLRRIFKENYDVEIGMYTYGNCFDVNSLDRKTTIGRYCSIAHGVIALTHNHPLDHPSTHSFFFNNCLGVVDAYLVEHHPLSIGNDVWIGQNAIILPSVSRIGDGAVIGAGAVVTKDVEPYSIVVGNPARLLRYRFSQETIVKLQESRWWEKSVGELDLNYFTRRLTEADLPDR